MDLDLFDAFDRDDGDIQLTESMQVEGGCVVGEVGGGASASKKRSILTEEEPVPGRKRVVTEVPTITTLSTVGEIGHSLTKFSALPADYGSSSCSSSSSSSSSGGGGDGAEAGSVAGGGGERPPAKVYPFKLDQFQQEAVNHIERGESVLVAAHTSAGKTAVAEYAIAKSLRDGQRVIYTSPIKALSNQKYRDLQEEFKDVGLMTGDMTINPNATCLIMTTEILRSMLYRGSEVMREVAWVIYDEVHYMRDKERGVVWEESIILLPHKVRFVFLSATIPNAKEFVGWVAKLHHQPCHVVYTDYRPVPLKHYVFPAAAQGLYLVVDEKGRFKEDSFQKAMSSLQAPSEMESIGNKKKGGKGNSSKQQQSSDLFKIVRLIMEQELDPCIVFSFSKRECEAYALQMARLDFNNEEEKELVEKVFENALESLSEDDRLLPQVVTILPLLKRGVGIHHGGLLPILKEVLEILFQEGLIKCLFATETFSIGINMPAKTVVFTATRKFDGQDHRWITSGEYIQMSGRAGRRGKDDSGIVIQMLDEKMDPEVAKNMIYGASDPLYSSYHVGYNMVLNMLRVEDADPENLLKASFHQYQQEQHAPELERRADELQREAMLIHIDDESVVSEYLQWSNLLEKISADMVSITMQPSYVVPFLNPGRLVHVRSNGADWGWGPIVAYKKGPFPSPKTAETVLGFPSSSKSSSSSGGGGGGGGGGGAAEGKDYIIEVLLQVRPLDFSELSPGVEASNFSQNMKILPCKVDAEEDGLQMQILSVSLLSIEGLSAIKLTLPPKLTTTESAKRGVQKTVREINKRFSGAIPLLDAVEDLGVVNDSFSALSNRAKELKLRVEGSPFHICTNKAQRVAAYNARFELLEESRLTRQKARETQTVTMRDELRRMKRVLRKLGYISNDGVLGTKGRFSCELSTADELVLTDMVFEGVFNEMSVEQAVALLSCFVHKEPVKDEASSTKFRGDVQAAFRQLQTVARSIAKECIDAKITLDEEDYVKSFNPSMIDATYAWCAGARFAEVCQLTDIFEGSIIRTLRRLEELLRQLASASVAIGNAELKKLFEDGATKIRRGVVFAASLYL